MKKPSVRRALKFLIWVFGSVALLMALLGGSGYFYFGRSLPQREGAIKAVGLKDRLEIIRDLDAVPHIYASKISDAYFGLGYVHAQDRLWQMEYQRRIAQGRLSEILGSDALPRDRIMRTAGLDRAARKAWDLLPSESKEIVNAYIAGVNAFISGPPGSNLSPEFKILGFQPELWTGPDVLALIKLLAWNLDNISYISEFLSNSVIQTVGIERAQQLLATYPDEGPFIVDSGNGEEEITAADGAWNSLMRFEDLNFGDIGSNNWVVDGTKTTTGKPMLASDPHLWTSVPSNWYLAHLSSGELDVIGATIPGLPMVIIGRNRSIAWGVTYLYADVQDLYLERFDTTGRMTEFKNQFIPLEILAETIKVKGRNDIAHIVRVTPNGPLLSDAINANNSEGGVDEDLGKVAPLSLRWASSEPEDNTVDSFLRVNRARNWEEFKEALRGYVAPGLNFVYADIESNIGYHAAGRIPVREQGKGFSPSEGWTGASEWKGWIPFDELPNSYNPPKHFIVTANNRPMSGENAQFLGRQWAAPYRAHRIEQMLKSKPKLSLDDQAAIQGDTVSLQARELLPLLLNIVTPRREDERQAVEMLKAWDCDVKGESAAAAIYEVWLDRLLRAMVEDELGTQLTGRYEQRFDYVSQFLYHTLKDQSGGWCDDITTPEQEDCAVISERALGEALDFLRENIGSDMTVWRWDRIHVLVFPHQPFDGNWALRTFFSRSIPNGGDRSTVNIGPIGINRNFQQRSAPGYRQLVDMSDTNGGRFIHAPGQSGHFLSSDYDNYLDDWRAVRYRRMRLDRAVVERDREATLILEP